MRVLPFIARRPARPPRARAGVVVAFPRTRAARPAAPRSTSAEREARLARAIADGLELPAAWLPFVAAL